MEQKIVIHAGFGKTATTWLQKAIFQQLESIVYLGKDPFLSPKIEETHNTLFKPLYNVGAYKPRLSIPTVNEYARCIYEECKKENTKRLNCFILSDENIFDFVAYNGELNIFLIQQFKKIIENLWGNRVSVNILLTIRNQPDMIQSYYAYSYFHLKSDFPTFDDFLKYGKDNPYETIFGGIRYCDMFEMLQEVFGEDKVGFVPYELLLNNPVDFVKSVCDFIGVSSSAVEELAWQPAENKNSTLNGSNIIRDMGMAGKLMNALAHLIHRHRHKIILPAGIRVKLNTGFGNAQRRWSKTKLHGSIRLSDDQRRQIHELYRDDNRRFMKASGIDISSLGYPV